MNRPAAARIRDELLETFADYHARIAMQTALVDELVHAVMAEERDRCADVAERFAQTAPTADARTFALTIAALIRAEQQD